MFVLAGKNKCVYGEEKLRSIIKNIIELRIDEKVGNHCLTDYICTFNCLHSVCMNNTF